MTRRRSALKPDLFAHEAHKRKIDTLGDPLQLIDEHIDFVQLAGLIDGLFPRPDGSKGGRPPYPTEVMVRVLVLKRLYNLSDEQVEYQLLDRMSFRRFCGLSDSATIPDRNTVWHFQQRIGVEGATALFQGVDAQIEQHGYIARGGQIIDATLVAAPIQRLTNKDKQALAEGQIPEDWNEAKRRQKDVDATHTKKHGKWHHGYKLSTSVDVKHKFIRKIHTSTASEHDSLHFEDVLDMGNTGSAVFADRGYTSKQHSQLLEVLGLKDHIQRKKPKGKPLGKRQVSRNQRIAKTRARGEHPYAQIRHMGGKLIRTIGQARATAAMTMMATCYNIKRLAMFLHKEVHPFYKNRALGA